MSTYRTIDSMCDCIHHIVLVFHSALEMTNQNIRDPLKSDLSVWVKEFGCLAGDICHVMFTTHSAEYREEFCTGAHFQLSSINPPGAQTHSHTHNTAGVRLLESMYKRPHQRLNWGWKPFGDISVSSSHSLVSLVLIYSMFTSEELSYRQQRLKTLWV